MSQLQAGVRIPAVHPANVEAMRAFVLHAEDLGFHSIWVGDHVFYGSDVLQPLHLLTWVAALTRRARLGTAVMLGAYRHPVLLAKAAATLDYLSGGRLTLGLSIGGTPDEYASLGVPMSQRVGRLVESAAILRQLWSTDDVSLAGRYVTVQHASINPKPVQPTGIPLWFGATSEAMRRRAARHADGWIGSSAMRIPDFVAAVESMRADRAAEGRAADRFSFAKLQGLSVHRDRSEARSLAERQWRAYYGPRFDVDAATVYGTPDDCVAGLQPLLDSGAPKLLLIIEPPTLGLAELDLLRETVERVERG